MSREGLDRLLHLTRELAAAVTRGDLDEALRLLEERSRALQAYPWPEAPEGELPEEICRLTELEARILDFCRQWRRVVAERLRLLNEIRLLRLGYWQAVAGGRFIDLNE